MSKAHAIIYSSRQGDGLLIRLGMPAGKKFIKNKKIN